jgi:hypothetical protein
VGGFGYGKFVSIGYQILLGMARIGYSTLSGKKSCREHEVGISVQSLK